ncbi:hypothetical protein I5535_04335 [Rhodobacteraceae bacterium F11138]|nr:hypothetical protein [Rhodobacteraceae bacterium F11138]
MTRFLLAIACAGMVSVSIPVQVDAGVIDRACRTSGRTAATPQMCRCIQSVAKDSLSRTDRRKAAKFFQDPHMAQEIRQSDRRSDEVFWLRYKAFGERARLACG